MRLRATLQLIYRKIGKAITEFDNTQLFWIFTAPITFLPNIFLQKDI